jgi:RNA polymerase sigma-70 factor (ECF subfamily)
MKTEHAEDAGPLDEAALVTTAQHDRAAFGPLYERYVDSIYRYVYHRVGNHVDAEDLTAQTFQYALATLSEFKPGGASFGAWLAAIARNLIAGGEQPETMSGEGIDDLPDPSAGDPAWRAAQAADAGELLTALRRLPLDQQRAIVLKFARGRSSREIGEALNLSESAARQLIHRALAALYAALESE